MSETNAVNPSANTIPSDYGRVDLELCDSQLRSKIVQSISNARNGVQDPKICINLERLSEISAYINRLEDALLRHHRGTLKEDEILDHLKMCAGFDIRGLAYSLDSMHAEDA